MLTRVCLLVLQFGEDALHYARAKRNAEAMRMLQPMDEQSE